MKNGFIFAGAAGLSFFAVLAPAVAQDYRYTTVHRHHHYTTVHGPRAPYYYYSPLPPGASAEQWTQYENDRSGTLGRQGLGADPRHPEGPGNVPSGR